MNTHDTRSSGIVPGLTLAGTGLAGYSLLDAAHKYNRVLRENLSGMKVPRAVEDLNPELLWPMRSMATTFGNVPAAEAAFLYPELAHQMAARPLFVGGEPIGKGVASLKEFHDTANSVTNAMETTLGGKVDRVLGLLRRNKKLESILPASLHEFLNNGANPFATGNADTAAALAHLRHFKAYGTSPAHGYLKNIEETADHVSRINTTLDRMYNLLHESTKYKDAGFPTQEAYFRSMLYENFPEVLKVKPPSTLSGRIAERVAFGKTPKVDTPVFEDAIKQFNELTQEAVAKYGNDPQAIYRHVMGDPRGRGFNIESWDDGAKGIMDVWQGYLRKKLGKQLKNPSTGIISDIRNDHSIIASIVNPIAGQRARNTGRSYVLGQKLLMPLLRMGTRRAGKAAGIGKLLAAATIPVGAFMTGRGLAIKNRQSSAKGLKKEGQYYDYSIPSERVIPINPKDFSGHSRYIGRSLRGGSSVSAAMLLAMLSARQARRRSQGEDVSEASIVTPAAMAGGLGGYGALEMDSPMARALARRGGGNVLPVYAGMSLGGRMGTGELVMAANQARALRAAGINATLYDPEVLNVRNDMALYRAISKRLGYDSSALGSYNLVDFRGRDQDTLLSALENKLGVSKDKLLSLEGLDLKNPKAVSEASIRTGIPESEILKLGKTHGAHRIVSPYGRHLFVNKATGKTDYASLLKELQLYGVADAGNISLDALKGKSPEQLAAIAADKSNPLSAILGMIKKPGDSKINPDLLGRFQQMLDSGKFDGIDPGTMRDYLKIVGADDLVSGRVRIGAPGDLLPALAKSRAYSTGESGMFYSALPLLDRGEWSVAERLGTFRNSREPHPLFGKELKVISPELIQEAEKAGVNVANGRELYAFMQEKAPGILAEGGQNPIALHNILGINANYDPARSGLKLRDELIPFAKADTSITNRNGLLAGISHKVNARRTRDFILRNNPALKAEDLAGKKIILLTSGGSGVQIAGKLAALDKALAGRNDVHILVQSGAPGPLNQGIDELIGKINAEHGGNRITSFRSAPFKDFQSFNKGVDLVASYGGSSTLSESLASRTPTFYFHDLATNRKNLGWAADRFGVKAYDLPSYYAAIAGENKAKELGIPVKEFWEHTLWDTKNPISKGFKVPETSFNIKNWDTVDLAPKINPREFEATLAKDLGEMLDNGAMTRASQAKRAKSFISLLSKRNKQAIGTAKSIMGGLRIPGKYKALGAVVGGLGLGGTAYGISRLATDANTNANTNGNIPAPVPPAIAPNNSSLSQDEGVLSKYKPYIPYAVGTTLLGGALAAYMARRRKRRTMKRGV